MYIRTDNEQNIVEVIYVGGMPEEHGYEISDIDPDILSDILNYKYVDGTFVKNQTSIRQRSLEKVKLQKIYNMNRICRLIIERGIDVNNKHYSLTLTDQLNLMKIRSTLIDNTVTSILYHADGENCRIYSIDEIREIISSSDAWIKYHTTYFNILRDQINQLIDVDAVIAVQYGMDLDNIHQEMLNTLIPNSQITFSSIPDEYDYESLFPSVKLTD